MSEPKRKSPRMKGFDYSTPTAYFITICTHQKKCIFGSPSQLNSYGQTAHRLLAELSNHIPGVKLEHFVIMPNHVHMLLTLTQAVSSGVSEIVSLYKAAVSREIHRSNPDLTVWQRSFHDHVVRTQDAWERIWKYIEENPYIWESDCFYHS